jgi:hypothetical protein
MRERGFLEERRALRQDATRSTDRLALATALVGGLLVFSVLLAQVVLSNARAPSVAGALSGAGAIQAPRIASGHVPETPQPAPTATAGSAPTVAPTPAPTGRRQVGGTDGQGVVLRASPREDDKTPRGFMDGTWVTVLDSNGSEWALVQGDNGQQGWIPARYLTR